LDRNVAHLEFQADLSVFSHGEVGDTEIGPL